MQVKVLFFATIKRQAGTSDAVIEVDESATARDVASAVSSRFDLDLSGVMVAVNDEYATPDRGVAPGDLVAFIPPVAGGSSDDSLLVTMKELPLADLHAALVAPEFGGQAVFTGSVRSPNQGVEVIAIEYEAYDAMCRQVMTELAAEARSRWELGRVALAHRTGRLVPGEVSLFVGVSSAHRQSCLEAVPWLVDRIKERLPVWKNEVTKQGEHWVEGHKDENFSL